MKNYGWKKMGLFGAFKENETEAEYLERHKFFADTKSDLLDIAEAERLKAIEAREKVDPVEEFERCEK